MEVFSRRKRQLPLFSGVAAFLFLAMLVTGMARGETIRLWDGRELEAEVLRHDAKVLVVQVPGHRNPTSLRWDQVDRSFALHPLHGKPVSDGSDRPGAAGSTEDPPKSAEAMRGLLPSRGSPVIFAYFLAGIFAVFWLNLWSVRMVGRWLPEDSRTPWRNFAVLLSGPLGLAFYWFSGRGSGKFLAQGSGHPFQTGAGAPASCQFYTWDNEPLKPGRKASSGLHVAQEIFARALATGASDVHFNTAAEGVRVSMRVDGVLRPPECLPQDSGRKVMAAVKMAAGMDVAKRHETQDGACRLLCGGTWHDLRVARAWAVEGETLVVRVLHSEGEGSDLAAFGMAETMARLAADLTKETFGIVILAGPTGSGKTTTIYALLRLVEGTGRNILTIEDPVEHRLENATQISLNPKLGSTFASALRASMRHDPDVILVGEIRDAETMDVAFHAALTGHLVFTSLHATGLLATIGRLRELGLSAYMIKTGLQAVICQRLVRTLCPSCRTPYLPEPAELEFWGLSPEDDVGTLFYRPGGCHLCDDSGYHGRRGVFRMVKMDQDLRAEIKADMDADELGKAIESAAMGTVPDYARALLAKGVTSPDELRRTIGMFDFGRTGPEE